MSKTAMTKEAVMRATLRNQPIEICGLKFYGMTIERYAEWQSMKSVLLMRQSKLPVLFLTMPFIDAMYALDMQHLEQEHKLAGTMYALLYTMAMSLRLPEGSVETQQIRIVTAKDGLKGFYVAQQEEAQDVFIPKETFQTIRQVIAWQQGDDLPDESLNDDLLETEKDIAQANAANLNFNFDDLLASVALNMHTRIVNLLDMTILEFETMRRAIDRDKKYTICGIAENGGTTWKGGNPCPSWSFDRENKESGALVSASKFSGITQKD